ncbi:MAG: tetratricopeptide repeat protein [Helicobacteraceae bacterium]|nr:tetratricopeptide repeat protein [Helicobacteraceae bacterium]
MINYLSNKLSIPRLLVICLLFCAPAFGEIKTYTKTVRETFSRSQTLESVKLSAIKKAESDIAREAGEYIATLTILKDGKIDKEDIAAISTAILQTEIKSEKRFMDGNNFAVELTIVSTLDTDTIAAQIDKILKSKETAAAKDNLQKQNKELQSKITELEKLDKNADDDAQIEETQIVLTLKKSNDKTPAEYVELGNAAYKIGNYTGALEQYTKALTIDPLYDDAYKRRGYTYNQIKEYDKAFADYLRALKINANDADALKSLAKISVNREMYNEAFAACDKALKIDPKDAEAYLYRADAYRAIGKIKKAISDYNMSLEINQNYADAYNNRAIAYELLGEHDQALADYAQAININRNHPTAFSNREQISFKLSDCNKTIQKANEALKIDPKDAESYYERAYAYYKLGDFKKAQEDYNSALQIKPNYAPAYNGRGRLYFRYGNLKKALGECNRALKIDPDAAYAHYTRGGIYAAMGDYLSALDDYQQAYLLGWQSAETREKISHIKQTLALLAHIEKEGLINYSPSRAEKVESNGDKNNNRINRLAKTINTASGARK